MHRRAGGRKSPARSNVANTGGLTSPARRACTLVRMTSFSRGPHAFATTHWSLVLAAGARKSPESTQALSTLCQNYWYPLYAYVRRRGLDPHEAQDLTQ